MRRFYGLVLLLLAFTAKAQTPDSLFRRLARQLALSDTATRSTVFLHLDKTVYAADENVWFAAYLLHAPPSQAHHTLYLTLLDEMAHRVVASYQFVLERGLASGSLALPDSLRSGHYCLAAYTNKSLAEQRPHVFRQPLQVLGLRKNPFALHVAGTRQENTLLFTGQLVRTQGSGALPPSVSLTIMADGQPYQQLEHRLSSSGQIQFTVPAALASKSLAISGQLGQGQERMAFKQPLTWLPTSNWLTFFPPAGRLLTGQAVQVAVSAKNSAGRALAKSCVLLENNAEIASFLTDRAGNGAFSFTPKAGQHYVVQFKGESSVPLQAFPAITAGNWGIRPLSSVVRDTLRLSVTTPAPGNACLVALHDTRAMRYGAYLRPRKTETLLKIPVGEWAAGILHVCLYQPDGTLLAKRLVLLQNPNPVRATLQADAASYKPLSPVALHLKVTTEKGAPVKGVFSFSVALALASTTETKDIEVFNHYERFLSDRVLLPAASGAPDDQQATALLLRQEYILTDSTWASSRLPRPAHYDGQVLYHDKELKKPIDLMVLSQQATLFQSDNLGRFTLPYQALRTDAGKKVALSVVGKNSLGYKIELTSPWAKVNAALATQYLWHSEGVPDELSSEQKQLLASTRVFLKDVVVTGKKADTGTYYGKANSSGTCSDYVCQFEVLNCPYHYGVKSPVEGYSYNLETATGITKVVYHCPYQAKSLFIRDVPATVKYTPFLPFNPSEPNSTAALSNSTLHWQAFVETDERGEATIRFHTNARSGRFKALVQGIAGSEVFRSELYFEVTQ
jgi:hypothetical protein